MNRQLQKIQEWMGYFYIPVVIVLLSLVILLVGYTSVQPVQYNFQLNQVAEDTIQAPVTIEDEYRTQQAREYARDSVENVFIYQPAILDSQVEIIQQLFEWLSTLRQGSFSTNDLTELAQEYPIRSSLVENIDQGRDANETVSFTDLNNSEQLIVYEALLTEQDDNLQALLSEVPAETITYLLNADTQVFQQLQSSLTTIVSTTLENQINASQLEQYRSETIEMIREQVNNRMIQDVLIDLAVPLIVPTVVYDEEATETRRQEVVNAVQPSYILQGQVIVERGHIIDAEDMRQLELLGFLDESTHQYNELTFYAMILVHALLIGYYFTKRFSKEAFYQAEPKMDITAYAIIFAISFIFVKLFNLLELNGINYAMLLFPIYGIPKMLIPEIGFKKTLIGVIFFIIFCLFLLSGIDNLTNVIIISLFYFFSALTSFIMTSKYNEKLPMYRQMLNGILWNIILMLPVLLIFNIAIVSNQFLLMISLVVFNIALAYLIYFLIRPYWEQLFNDRAILTLNQLSNMNHPLLKKLINEAPGTYNHSMLVANLSANAVEEIKGDSLLTRVASYYHDIGKTIHPLFFTENVKGGMESPHSVITAEESAAIIIDHVNKGANILTEYNFPQSIIDICLQHHGTTLVRYFYYEASKEGEVTEAHFKYDGPKPQTKEAAVIMIADSVEAASRSLKEYSQEAIETLVENIINNKKTENQFSECNLTVHELQIVRKSLISGVASMYHTRVDYPE